MRNTYKGRELKVLASRKAGHVRTYVNGYIHSWGFEGTAQQAFDNLRDIIDLIDANGIGNNRYDTAANWYVLGTYDLNGNKHPITPGGKCICSMCEMWPDKNQPPADPTGCGACMIPQEGHGRLHGTVIGWHDWIQPTEAQLNGRLTVHASA